MKLLYPALPIAAMSGLLLLGGCMTSTSYDASAEAMRHSPALLADRIAACSRSFQNSSPVTMNSLRQDLKLPVGTSDATVAETGCRRGLTAIAQGRMTYDDLNSIYTGNPKPVVFRIMQGR